ncbi:MAG: PAS domain-containing sensor histidine kinase [Desulfocapsaceae bacterium]|jgi:signal transduction histidine kinase|nr:PAS domain-containing sensor histidine kinase [Desulfocapsaceae bacterium]
MKADDLPKKDFLQNQGYTPILKQFCWYMIWPLITVLLVITIFYLDRVYTFEALTVRQEDIRLESLQLLSQDRNQAIVDDMQYLGRHRLLHAYLSDPSAQNSAALTELFESFLSKKAPYSRIRVLGREATELLTTTKSGGHAETASGSDQLFESPSFFEMLLQQQSERIYLNTFSVKRPVDSHHVAETGSLQRLYYIVGRNQAEAAGLLTLDYDSVELFKPFYTSDQEGVGRTLLLDRESSQVIVGEQSRGGDLAAGPDAPVAPVEQHTMFADLQGQLSGLIAIQPSGHFFKDKKLYVYRSFRPFPPEVTDVHTENPGMYRLHGEDDPDHWFLVSEVDDRYFAAQKRYYLKFLVLLGVTLLVPSLVVCLFLARYKARVKKEAALRYREHLDHLEQMEAKVQQRTQELDKSNQQLSSEIIERLGAERQLRRNNELLSGMIGSIDGIIYVADFDSHEILFANEYLKSLFGFDPVGRLCWQFLHANQDGPCSFCTNCRLLDDAGSPAPPLQWEYQNPYNKRWYLAKDQAIRWSNGKYVRLEIATDITEQKRLQHFLQEARRSAELAKGIHSRFVALVAHDLKSPFFSIIQMLQRILDRETFTYRVHRQFLENIVENGHRMLQMIDNLLSIDRFETGEIKLDKSFFDVSLMAEEVLQNFKHLASEKNLSVANEIPAETFLYADRYLYYIVLNNLVSNAVKFSDRYGRVILAGDGCEQSATIVVKDDGKGMSEEYLKNLFRADVKTSRQGTHGEQGSGLGLIFCQDILKAHHGEILVESGQGRGSSFSVILPRCSGIDWGKRLKEIKKPDHECDGSQP